MKINIETIPHSEQHYDTPGDYWLDKNGVWQVRISSVNNILMETLVMLHELFELVDTQRLGIQLTDIDNFDMVYEQNREKGDDSEPGDSKKAPYYESHQKATALERTACVFFGLDWNDYDLKINEL